MVTGKNISALADANVVANLYCCVVVDPNTFATHVVSDFGETMVILIVNKGGLIIGAGRPIRAPNARKIAVLARVTAVVQEDLTEQHSTDHEPHRPHC